MVVQVSTTDARSLKALALLATADQWTKGHRKSDGRSFFAIPSNSGHVYWVDSRECTCPDFVKRSPQQPGFACKHILACRLWIAQQEGSKAQQCTTRYAALFGQEEDKPWCVGCNRHHTPGGHYSKAS